MMRPAPGRRAPSVMLVSVLALVVAGCASPRVTDLGGGYHSVVREASTPLTRLSSLQEDTHRAAASFCAQRQRVVEVLKERDTTTWTVTGNTPRAELQFSCVARPSAASSEAPVAPPAPVLPSVTTPASAVPPRPPAASAPPSAPAKAREKSSPKAAPKAAPQARPAAASQPVAPAGR